MSANDTEERLEVQLAVYLIFDDLQLLLMRRYNTGYRDGELGLPSGHCRKGETPKRALVREVFEETGVELDEDWLTLVHTQYNAESGPDMTYLNLYFITRRWRGEPMINEPHKCSEIVWVKSPPSGTARVFPLGVIPHVMEAIDAYDKSKYRRGGGRDIYSEV